jgi:sulfonate transport system substrate-binding protein
VEAAGADKIDVAGVGSTPPIFGAAAKGSEFRVVAQIQYAKQQDDSLLVRTDSGITDAKGLKGKAVAIPKGSSAHGFFLNYLDRNGVKESDVDVKFLAPADALAAFSAGKVDAFAVWQPFVVQAEKEGGKAIAGGRPDEDGFSFEIASTKAVQDGKRAAALKDYMGRLAVAFKWARTHPDQWAAAWSKESGLPLDVTKVAVRERAQSIAPVSDEARQSEQKLADTLAKHEVIPGKVTFDDIVTTGLAPEEEN